MRKLFLDTNILIDFLASREPYAKLIFLVAAIHTYELFTSNNSITTGYNILEKETTSELAKKAIPALLNYMQIVNVTKDIPCRH